MPVLETRVEIARPRLEVFDFFSRAENLGRITPPELAFRILTPLPVEMREGARIDYRIGLFGVPMTWKTLITAWEPPHRFADLQMQGPYAYWHHTHTFEETATGTLMRDHVEYRLPLAPLGNVALPLIRLQLARIFAYREGAIRRMLPEAAPAPPRVAHANG